MGEIELGREGVLRMRAGMRMGTGVGMGMGMEGGRLELWMMGG